MNGLKTFMDEYKEKIEPKIKEIDIFMKSHSNPFNKKKSAELLNISESELQQIMEIENIETINRYNFFKIMKKGSSPICRLFARQLQRGFENYTPEDISYIYDIDITVVLEASRKIGISQFDDVLLKTLFENIMI